MYLLMCLIIVLGAILAVKSDEESGYMRVLGLATIATGLAGFFGIYAPSMFFVFSGVILIVLGFRVNPGYGTGQMGAALLHTTGGIGLVIGGVCSAVTYLMTCIF